MKKIIVMDSEYCSMGRWISLIAGHHLQMKLYEGKDLIQLADEKWLTEKYLQEFDERIADMTLQEVIDDGEIQKVHRALSKAILKAIELGPCIIHERAASEILKDRQDCLKVLLYNTHMEHRVPRALGDKTYNLENKTHAEVIDFIHREDHKRQVYHDAVSINKWGDKEAYDLCLDSDILSREKCAEILIEAARDVSLDLEECSEIIRQTFSWSR